VFDSVGKRFFTMLTGLSKKKLLFDIKLFILHLLITLTLR